MDESLRGAVSEVENEGHRGGRVGPCAEGGGEAKLAGVV